MIAIFNNRPHSTRVQKNIELMDLRILGNLCKLVSLSVMVIMACSLSLMAQTPCNTDCNGTNTFVGNNAGAVNTATSNTFVGNNSGSMNTSGQANAFFGSSAGLFSQSGNDNSYFGASAGVSNTTGSNNSFFGNTAGFTNRASNNSFFGASVGSSNNTGTNNAFFGRQTGQNNVSGSSNSFFGNNAGNNNVSGVSNVFVGLDAGFNNLASDNSFFGRDAGHRITTGAGNVAIGRGAGPTSANATLSNRLYIDVNTAGSTGSDTPLIYGEFDNDFVRINGTLEVTDGMRGRLELSNTDTDNSVFIGVGAGAMDDGTNNRNVFVGETTGTMNTRGSNNSFFGDDAGFQNISGSFNSFFGSESGSRNTTGRSNSIFGQGSGAQITTGSNNVVLGRGAGPTSANAAASSRLYIDLVEGGNAGNDNPLIYGEFDNDFVRINGTLEVTDGMRGRLELSNTDTDNSVFIGAGAGAMDDGNNSNVFVGGSTGINNTRGFNNSFFGESVGSANTTGDFNSFFGNESGVRITTGQSNSIFGQGSGARITTGSNNVVLGRGAGPTSANAAASSRLYIDLVASGNDGNDNPLIYGEFDNDFVRINGALEVTDGMRGRLELSNTDTDNSVFIGASAGVVDDGNNFNVFVGGQAGATNTSGNANSFFGAATGSSNSTGFSNSFFGTNAGLASNTGFENSFFGNQSGFSNTTGANNSFFGDAAGFQITTGSNNVVIGGGAGPTSSNATTSNRLYIDIEPTSLDGNDAPLIYGEFDNDFVRINGTFEVTGGLTNPSSRTLKNQFVSLDASTILAKLASLNIQQWAYKARPDEKHVGPIAEEFYAAFGLGQGDKNISTIDADGIMMLAIQALQQENAQLAQGMHQKDQQITELENRLARIEQLLLEKK